MFEEKCDYIFSLGVIHHIKNPEDVIQNISSNLNDNGKFLLASEMFSKMISDNTLDEFLTLPAYKYI